MNTPQDFDDFATHIHSDEMIPMNHDETDTYLTPDQLISELRTEIRHLKREYELLERTATGALSIVIEHALSIVIEQKHLNHEYELLKLTADDALFLLIDAVETHKVRFKHDSSTSAMEAPRHSDLLPGKES